MRPSSSMTRDIQHSVVNSLLVASLLMLTGCSSKPEISVYETRGSLLVGGKPASGAVIGFHPLSGDFDSRGTRPAGVVNSDGSFEVSTFGLNDGSPAGEYALSIVWPQYPGKDDPGEDRLRGKYANPKTSTIHVKIEERLNQLDSIDLKN